MLPITDNHRIQKFDGSGTFLTKWGSQGSDEGQFSYPCGVAVDSSGNVYVLEFGNCRIQKFAAAVLPVANFTSNVTSGYAPLTVQFTDLSKNATLWKWNFGDGTSSTKQNPMHKYSKAGKYTVALTATNAEGNNTTTKANYIKVKAPLKPVANFTGNVTSGKAPLNIIFTDKSTGIPT
ncbi:PKD domain-containing protein, partial [Methanosarcina sp. UBA5]|uniref:PKD domain-containing protein n=1 Tax=Methanosarcina sp. UBA5 TaxID=1915593 RepID=UPI0032E4BBE1